MKLWPTSLGLILVYCCFSHASTPLSISSISTGPGGASEIRFSSNTNFYYVLYRADSVTNAMIPIAAVLGSDPESLLIDTQSALAAFYRVREISMAQPLDLDGDGIADLYELRHRPCLDPLNPSDAAGDCDSDGATNLAEYLAGTDPVVPETSANAFAGLVINEVDYDSVGTDNAEFIELYNSSTNTLNLTNVAVVLINGANHLQYGRIDLNGSLAPDEYLVIAGPNLTNIDISHIIRVGSDFIQNGAPDGIALFHFGLNRLLDSLSYEGSITAATINGLADAVNLVEGTALPASVADSNTAIRSLARLPNGSDTNDASSDWKSTGNPTPGSANLP